jgi:hypothetical protein
LITEKQWLDFFYLNVAARAGRASLGKEFSIGKFHRRVHHHQIPTMVYDHSCDECLIFSIISGY